MPWAATTALTAQAPAVLLGSHLDTVRNAGRYDGLFGILSAIACVRALHEAGKRLPFALEVVAFGDEEGVRFGITMSGSRALAGTFDPAWLNRTDADGVSLAEALRGFGGDPEGIPALRRARADILAYVESHIEQGPVLLDAGMAVGVVTAIAGATRVRVRVTGLSGSCRHRPHDRPSRCARGCGRDGPRGRAPLRRWRHAGGNRGAAHGP